MLFRRLITNAIGAGLLAGLIMSLLQVLTVNPILLAAEGYEQSAASVQGTNPASPSNTQAQQGSDADSSGLSEQDAHHHSADAWAPEDGVERMLSTTLANVMAGIGFAALVLAVMSQLQLQGIERMSVLKGVAWGVAGFTAFFVAPGLGMPPEIPGAESAPVAHRQVWWMLVVVGVSTGLLLLVYAPVKWKVLGLVCIAAPYLVAVPQSDAPMFSNPDPTVVQSLMALHQQFIVASGFTNFVFWLVLGGVCAWVLNRWVLPGIDVPSRTELSAPGP